jgi:selenium-binding protein 1
VVVSLKDLSASIWLWKRNNGHRGATKVIEIPAEPADPDLLPPLLEGFEAVPPFVTDINLSVDDKMALCILLANCAVTTAVLQLCR